MAYTISLHTYKDADIIKAIKEAEQLGASKGKASKVIMKLGIEAWNSLDQDQKKEELSK